MPIEIVPGTIELGESFFECFDQVAKERRYLSFTEAPPKHEVIAFSKMKIEQGHTLFYAVEKETVIGWCDILRKSLPALSHSGILGLGIRNGYRGNGVGRRLMEASMADADQKKLSRVELWVFDHNQPALTLYLKFGFKIEGKMTQYASLNGICYDAWLMSRTRRSEIGNKE